MLLFVNLFKWIWRTVERIELNRYSENNRVCKHSFYVMSFLWRLLMTLRDSHKITKIFTKFWIRIKRTDISHKCPADTSDFGPALNRITNWSSMTTGSSLTLQQSQHAAQPNIWQRHLGLGWTYHWHLRPCLAYWVGACMAECGAPTLYIIMKWISTK